MQVPSWTVLQEQIHPDVRRTDIQTTIVASSDTEGSAHTDSTTDGHEQRTLVKQPTTYVKCDILESLHDCWNPGGMQGSHPAPKVPGAQAISSCTILALETSYTHAHRGQGPSARLGEAENYLDCAKFA